MTYRFKHPAESWPQAICNFIVAYLIPLPLWRVWARFPYWHRWYWRNR